MKIFPAIDLKDGKAVRLYQGDYGKMTVYSETPCDVAGEFAAAGAECLHLVDLDGALSGGRKNVQIIEDIVSQTKMFVEVGGGIRDLAALENYVLSGVDRVIIGSAAVENPKFLSEAVAKYGDKIAVGVDARDGFVAIHGWKTVTDINAYEFCEKLVKDGVKCVVYTDIACDGTLEGPNFGAYERLSALKGLNVVASGGVSSLDDLKKLKRTGVYGAILGKALYAHRIKLEDALALN